MKEIITSNGTPKSISTDNGLEFKKKEMISPSKKYGFKWRHSSLNYDKTAGVVERVNQTFLRKLRKIYDYRIFNLEDKIDKAILAVNISFKRALNTLPYIFSYAKSYTFPIDNTINRKQEIFKKEELIRRKIKEWPKDAKKNSTLFIIYMWKTHRCPSIYTPSSL